MLKNYAKKNQEWVPAIDKKLEEIRHTIQHFENH